MSVSFPWNTQSQSGGGHAQACGFEVKDLDTIFGWKARHDLNETYREKVKQRTLGLSLEIQEGIQKGLPFRICCHRIPYRDLQTSLDKLKGFLPSGWSVVNSYDKECNPDMNMPLIFPLGDMDDDLGELDVSKACKLGDEGCEACQ